MSIDERFSHYCLLCAELTALVTIRSIAHYSNQSSEMSQTVTVDKDNNNNNRDNNNCNNNNINSNASTASEPSSDGDVASKRRSWHHCIHHACRRRVHLNGKTKTGYVVPSPIKRKHSAIRSLCSSKDNITYDSWHTSCQRLVMRAQVLVTKVFRSSDVCLHALAG